MKKYLNKTIIIGAILLILGIILPLIISLFTPKNQTSVGIIGGADYPTLDLTFFYWQRSFYSTISRFGFATIIWGIINHIFSKSVKENCTVKSNLLSLSLSASLACALYCFFAATFSEIHKNPLSHLWGSYGFAVGCIFSLFILVFLIISYIISKKTIRIIYDTTILVLFFYPFITLGNNIYNLLSDIAWEIYH